MYRQMYPDAPGMHNTGGRYTHVERASTFCERVRGSLCAMLVGMVLVPAAVVLLGYNEGRAVNTSKALDEGLASVIELRSSQVVEPQLNGRLVHLTDWIHCDGILNDATFGVAVGAVSLKRTVEMYQWVETVDRHERELDNGDKEVTKTYSYDTVWRKELVRSSGFDSPYMHKNPDSLPFQSEKFSADRVTLGAFSLSNKLVEGVNEYTDLRPTVIPENLSYVGDVRVSFSYAGLCKDSRLGPVQKVSVMAMQQDFTLTGYQTQAGRVIEMLTLGKNLHWFMIQRAHSENIMLTWLLRCLGTFVMFLGFTCLTSILRSLVSFLPIARDLVGLSVTMFNIFTSMSVSLLTIALSWIFYRPVFALAITALSAAFILLPSRQQRYTRHHYP
ncbi:transmembrane protein 43-like isoform X2 [Watersipora subatra]|uniref:transmembrane protein 43-like isoform X2 n=1 Tax=Watersipora subatra TaxID=2589382 RepID=UPI00355C62B8